MVPETHNSLLLGMDNLRHMDTVCLGYSTGKLNLLPLSKMNANTPTIAQEEPTSYCPTFSD